MQGRQNCFLLGISSLEYINFSYIEETNGNIIKFHEIKKKDGENIAIPINHNYKNQIHYLGTMHVNYYTPSRSCILKENMIETVLYEAILFFFILISLYVVMQKIIVKPINKLASALYLLTEEQDVISLGRKKVFKVNDQIDFLEESVNVLLSKIKQENREKTVLLKEIHHRVKNNLQIISSLINMQAFSQEDQNIYNQLTTTSNRIQTMGHLHKTLYQAHDFSHISMWLYLDKIIKQILELSYDKEVEISYELQIDHIYLTMGQAVPCGLIVNEIISNAVKYAFKGRKKGKITISVDIKNEEYLTLIIKDDGIGMDKDINFEEYCGLGLKLIQSLSDQLHAELDLNRDNGTTYTIVFSNQACSDA